MQPRSAVPPSILNQLPSSHLCRLMRSGRSMSLLRGEVLFHQDEPGDSCYWLVKGTLKVSVCSDTGEERIFSLLGPGSVVGELAILDKLPRSATVTAVCDSDLTELRRSALDIYLRRFPEVSFDLIAIVIGRLRKANDELRADSFLGKRARVARA